MIKGLVGFVIGMYILHLFKGNKKKNDNKGKTV